ncbi:hypothetical protein EV356DRAFT_512884 [Viridothelium virens]|uniref:SMP-30/Gluconolactonase/LRE-like region domain-containing protein n=1 Tax=Viridothelium virens TaxID=1048519 RepID=A0A6A6HFR6_VIRVR|nr:hypothetical protein EV356DRAFT_512884 [Viridothelium virens]
MDYTSNISLSWISSTHTSDASLNSLLSVATNASFISYSPTFTSLLGPAPQFKLVAACPNQSFAFEAGLWASDRNEVWFTSSSTVYGNQTFVSVLSLQNNTVTTPRFDPPLKGVNGGYYFNKTVYFTTFGTDAGIISIDPHTLSWKTVLNSYYGLQLGFVDDIAWLKQEGERVRLLQYHWQRWGTLQPVIPQSDVQFPNGVRVNAEGTKLYVSDTTSPVLEAGLTKTTFWGSPSIYVYDLVPSTSSPSSPPKPVNKSQFSLVRTGFADGLHLDDSGRVWSAEGDGIWVRASDGEVLGVFDAAPLLAGETVETGGDVAIANFALAGDTLVVLAHSRICTLKLAETIVKGGNLS